MKQIRELLKNINVWRGHKPDAPISNAMVGTYTITDLDPRHISNATCNTNSTY